MKRLFALLLLANAGLAMWGAWYRGSPDAQRHARPPVNAQSMRLLSEPGAVPVPRAPASEPAPLSPLQPSTARDPACFSIGPFHDVRRVHAALVKLSGSEWGAHERDESHPIARAYRVFLPPAPTFAAAEAKRRELTRLGVRDHYLIEERGERNAISLGVFSTQAAARRLAARLAKKGIAARIETLFHTEKQYWVDAQAPDAAALAQVPWTSSELIRRACDTAALIPVSAPRP